MRKAALVLTAALAALGAAAQADELLFFRSPSGNIHCLIATGEWAEARCDIFERTPSFPKPPADCDLDWGHAFSVGPEGQGAPACVGDTVRTPDSFVLDYGQSVERGGFVCTSEGTGMTCANRAGHGFTLARAAQQVF